MFLKRLLITVFALSALIQSAKAQPGPVPATVITSNQTSESVNNGQANWQEQEIAIRSGFAPRALWELAARRSQRFGLVDNAVSAALAAPLTDQFSGAISIAVSPSHHFLPTTNLTVDLARTLGSGWEIHGGINARRYTQLNTNAINLGVDKYIGDWRLAAQGSYARSNLGPVGTSIRWQADRDFGDRAKVSAIVAVGRELDPAQPAAQAYAVSSAAIFGTVPISKQFALRGEVSSNKLGSLYRRNGARVGLEYQL